VNELVQQSQCAISVLPASAALAEESFDINPRTLKKSFQGWLDAVASQGTTPHAAVHHMLLLPPRLDSVLTTEEFIQVNLVTVRESKAHRCWPPDVIATFLAAEVIRQRSGIER